MHSELDRVHCSYEHEDEVLKNERQGSSIDEESVGIIRRYDTNVCVYEQYVRT